MVCGELSGMLWLERPDPQRLVPLLVGCRLPETPLLWAEDHPDLTPDPHLKRSLAALAARRTLLVYLTPAEAPDEEDPGFFQVQARRAETMGRAYRDQGEALDDLGVEVVGVSTQAIDEQREIACYGLYSHVRLCDEDLVLARELGLPIAIRAARVEYQSLVLIATDGVIAHAIYPVSSPTHSARAALTWLTGPVEERAGERQAG